MSDDEMVDDLQLEDEQLDPSSEDENMENPSDNSAAALSRQKSYLVIEYEEIVGESKKILKEVMDLLSLPSQAAAVALLRHFS